MSFTSPLISPFFFLFSCTISYVSLTCFRFLSSEPHSWRGCLGTLTSTDVKNRRLRAGFRNSHRIRVKLSVSWQTGSEKFTASLFVASVCRMQYGMRRWSASHSKLSSISLFHCCYFYSLLFHFCHCINIYSNWLGAQFCYLSSNKLYILSLK
jgi:hypothetical protein